MPTPTGKLRRGDLIRHKDGGPVCEVIERLGNDDQYSVRIRRLDGKPFTSSQRMDRIMTETAYWLDNGWEVVTASKGVIHAHPKRYSDVTPCCGLRTRELGQYDLTTTDPHNVTCKGASPATTDLRETEGLLPTLRQAALPLVEDLVTALVAQGMSKEKALKTIRWATHVLEGRATVTPPTEQEKDR